MRKKEKLTAHIVCLSILLLILAAEVYIVTKDGYLYGNHGDWYSQHVELPSYLRQLYYRTGKFFPDFAMNLGMGQSIYYIAYYGLFSPVVLVSYLLPDVSMVTYMTVASIVMAALTIVLLYRWISHHLPILETFAASLFFTLAVPFMYHSHHHLMFVNYLPFLILAMEGLEKFVKDGRRLQLVISFFLVIMSSYFFSVGCTAVLCVYWIYLYLKRRGRIRLLSFVKDGLKFAATLLISVMMSAVLWLPVLKIMLEGRADTTKLFSTGDLLLPGFQSDSFFYSSSSLGLSAIFFICVCWLLISRRRHRVFAGIIFIVMMFSALPVYILNGGMYINGKALIPFLPFAALMHGGFIKDTADRGYRLWLLLIVTAALALPALLTWEGTSATRTVFIPDLILSVCAVLLLYTRRSRKQAARTAVNAVLICVMAFPLLNVSYVTNINDSLTYADENSRTMYSRYARQLLEGDGRPVIEDKKPAKKSEAEAADDNISFFRTDLLYDIDGTANFVLDDSQMRSTIYSSLSNAGYRSYYYKDAGNNISAHSNAIVRPTKNVMNSLTDGVRYLIVPRGRKALPTYKPKAIAGSLELCESEKAVPVGYASETGVFTPEVRELSTKKIKKALSSIAIENSDGSLSFDLKDRTEIKIPIKPAHRKRIIRLVMHVDNSSYLSDRKEDETAGEIMIKINSTANLLASPNWRYSNHNSDFNYTLYVKKNAKSLNFKADPGRFTVSDIKMYSYNFKQYKEWRDHIAAWDAKQESDNMLSGEIRAKKDGSMIINIPYDEGFTVKVDGKTTAYEKSPNAFISIPIEKGDHYVSLVFNAPGKTAGIRISAAGFCLLAALEIADLIKRRRKKTRQTDPE